MLLEKIQHLIKRQAKIKRLSYSKLLGHYESDNPHQFYLHSCFFHERGCNVLFSDNMQYPHLDVDTFTINTTINEIYRNETIMLEEYEKILKVQRQAKKRGKELLLAEGDPFAPAYIESEIEFVGIILSETHVLVRFVNLPEKIKEYKIYLSLENLFLKEDIWQEKIKEIKLDTAQKIANHKMEQIAMKEMLKFRKLNNNQQ